MMMMIHPCLINVYFMDEGEKQGSLWRSVWKGTSLPFYWLSEELLCPVTSTQPPRTGRQGVLQVPCTRHVHLVGPRKRIFLMAGPFLWNIIPSKVWLAPNLLLFQKGLKMRFSLGGIQGPQMEEEPIKWLNWLWYCCCFYVVVFVF